MAQAPSFKSAIRYEVCNSAVLDDQPTAGDGAPRLPLTDDLCEITIAPTSLSPNHYGSPSSEARGSSASIQSLSKSIAVPSHPNSSNQRSPSRQSIFGTLATTLTAVRKSSTSALALAQQRLSSDNGNLFSAYQGKTKQRTKLTC